MQNVKTITKLSLLLTCLMLISACEKPAETAATPAPASPAPQAEIAPEPAKSAALAGDYCFKAEVNKDITEVNLNIAGSQVTGAMNWIPDQKDGARGNLAGTVNAAGEFDLMYDYMIEGNQQTETKVMKIENDQLMIKRGELIDPKEDGNLQYKDVASATYKESLPKVECKK